MRATLSSTRSRSLCTTTSGDVGGSYGSDTPVKCSNLAGQRLAVEALHVALDEHLERRLDVDLDERHAAFLGQPTDLLAHRPHRVRSPR